MRNIRGERHPARARGPSRAPELTRLAIRVRLRNVRRERPRPAAARLGRRVLPRRRRRRDQRRSRLDLAVARQGERRPRSFDTRHPRHVGAQVGAQRAHRRPAAEGDLLGSPRRHRRRSRHRVLGGRQCPPHVGLDLVERPFRQVRAPLRAVRILPAVAVARVRLGRIHGQQGRRQRHPRRRRGRVPSADSGRSAFGPRSQIRPEAGSRLPRHLQEREVELGQVALEIRLQTVGELPHLGVGRRPSLDRQQRATGSQDLRVARSDRAAQVGERDPAAIEGQPAVPVGVVAAVAGCQGLAGVRALRVEGSRGVVGHVDRHAIGRERRQRHRRQQAQEGEGSGRSTHAASVPPAGACPQHLVADSRVPVDRALSLPPLSARASGACAPLRYPRRPRTSSEVPRCLGSCLVRPIRCCYPLRERHL